MLKQNQIDYTPHSRPKRYFILESQLRSGVKGASFSEIYELPKSRYVPVRGIAWLCVIAALLYLVLFFGGFDFLPEILK